MKGFSLSRGLRLAADVCDKRGYTVVWDYFGYRWRHAGAMFSYAFLDGAEKVHLDASGKIVAAGDTSVVKVSDRYDEWYNKNWDAGYNRATRVLVLTGCAIGVVLGINVSAIRRSWNRLEETALDTIVNTTLFGVGGAVTMYFSHIVLPLVVVGSSIVLTRNALATLYCSPANGRGDFEGGCVRGD